MSNLISILLWIGLLLIPSLVSAKTYVVSPQQTHSWFADSLRTYEPTVEYSQCAPQIQSDSDYVIYLLLKDSDPSISYETYSDCRLSTIMSGSLLGLTYGCLDYLDSLKVMPFGSTWSSEYCSPYESRTVFITQRPQDRWPLAKRQLIEAIYAARVTDVVLCGMENGWWPLQVPYLDTLVGICQSAGVGVRFSVIPFTKMSMNTKSCLLSLLPFKRPLDVFKDYVWRPSEVAYRRFLITAGASGNLGRVFVPVRFGLWHSDPISRFYVLSFIAKADPSTPKVNLLFRWLRDTKYTPTAGSEKVVESYLTPPTSWVRYRFEVPSMENMNWSALFLSYAGKIWIDSIEVRESLPSYIGHCPTSFDTITWTQYQRVGPYGYLGSRVLRFDLPESRGFFSIMDRIAERWNSSGVVRGMFISCDEPFLFGYEPEFKAKYSNAGAGFMDYVKDLSEYHKRFWSEPVLMYGDNFDPQHNARQYVRAVCPDNGGMLNSRLLLSDRNFVDLVIWGHNTRDKILSSSTIFTTEEWVWSAGIDLGGYNLEYPIWKSLQNEGHIIRSLFFFDWGDQYFTHESLSRIHKDFYK